MTTITTIATIEAIDRLTSSKNGNPRYEIAYRREDGTQAIRNTAADASFAYEIGNPGMRVGSVVILTISGRGTICNMRTANPSGHPTPESAHCT